MSVVVTPPAPPAAPPAGAGPSPQEAAWSLAEAETAAVMGTVNVAVARLVAALRMLLDTDGWVGPGIQSPEHWVTWKAGVSRSRAEGLVRIARRAGELPACWALFVHGRLGEDAMARIARRVPAARDAAVAALAPQLLVPQLDRLLRSLPDQPDGTDRPPTPAPQRSCRLRERSDGWLRGEFCLPPDEAAAFQLGLTAARDAELHHDEAGRVTWADGLVRMAAEAAGALDRTFTRSGQPGDRNVVVLHHDVDPTGALGPGQIELGAAVPDTVARFLSCDARVQVLTYRLGQLAGINPAERTPNRATRRYLARRDQGCTHPLCPQRRWLHAHHIVHWADGGPTAPANLLLLCPQHHRALHHGDFAIEGDPEAGTLRFLDRFGRPITPPGLDPPPAPHPDDDPPPYTPPTAEPLRGHSFHWN
ncbi:MAG TPA: DUF222 domain-containing protein [Acidimicrobiales bacterium]|nr:DUF222 domain-containing protein [Acidimicrobiales bacterium]